MPIPTNAPRESLADDLTLSLWHERATLHLLARRKGSLDRYFKGYAVCQAKFGVGCQRNRRAGG